MAGVSKLAPPMRIRNGVTGARSSRNGAGGGSRAALLGRRSQPAQGPYRVLQGPTAGCCKAGSGDHPGRRPQSTGHAPVSAGPPSQAGGRACLARHKHAAGQRAAQLSKELLAAQSNLAAPSAPPLPLPQAQRAPTWEALPVAYPAVYRPQGPAGAQGAPAPAQARPRQAPAVCPGAAGATRGAEGRCRGLAGAVAGGRPAEVRGAC